MHKYITLIKTELGRLTTYRFELFWRWGLIITQIAVYYSLWNMTSTTSENSQNLLLHFSLYYLIFHTIRTSTVGENMSIAIRTGSINNFLTKPISYPFVAIIQVITKTVARIIIPSGLLIIGVFIFPSYFAPYSISSLLFFTIFTLLWLLLWNSIMIFFGSLSFWLREISSLLTVLDLILNIVNGAFIPVFLMPESAQKIISYTPIYFMGTFQIELYQSSISIEKVFQNLLILTGWTIITVLIAILTYRKGLIKYDASGG